MKQQVISALLGVCVGDAAGAVLEFFDNTIKEEDVLMALTMPGGGVFDVGKGQPTDDTELTLCLLDALIRHDPSEPFPKKDIVRNYVKWMNSCPFDYGKTTQLAFGGSYPDNKDIHKQVENSARMFSMDSEANGALMRVIPIALWYHKLPYEKIGEYARQDALFSHPNIVCQDCNAVYCITVAYLLNNPKDWESAIKIAEEYIRKNCSEKVRLWFYDCLTEDFMDRIDCTRFIGHVKHAFQMSFHFLFYATDFKEVLFKTLYKAGDTDTNAAIVCGMMGAYHGKIPDELVKPIMNFDCVNEGRRRPYIYSVKRFIKRLQDL